MCSSDLACLCCRRVWHHAVYVGRDERLYSEEIGEAPYFLVGDGANLCYNTIKDHCIGLRLAPPELRYATGFGVAAAALPLAQAGKTCSPQELDAFYLRRPQAERERMKRLAENR